MCLGFTSQNHVRENLPDVNFRSYCQTETCRMNWKMWTHPGASAARRSSAPQRVVAFRVQLSIGMTGLSVCCCRLSFVRCEMGSSQVFYFVLYFVLQWNDAASSVFPMALLISFSMHKHVLFVYQRVDFVFVQSIFYSWICSEQGKKKKVPSPLQHPSLCFYFCYKAFEKVSGLRQKKRSNLCGQNHRCTVLLPPDK